MKTKAERAQQLVDEGELERITDSDPPLYRMTPECKRENLELAYIATREFVHLQVKALHEYMDQMGSVIDSLHENAPFTEDDIPDEADDEAPVTSSRVFNGYL